MLAWIEEGEMGKVSELLLENEALKNDLSAAREQLADREMQVELLQAAIDAKEEVHTEDFARLEGQLAEMREALQMLVDSITPLDNLRWAAYENAQKLLSAVFAGGRVLTRNGWAILMYTDKGGTYTMIELAGPALEGFTEDGESVIVTLKKAPPSADEE